MYTEIADGIEAKVDSGYLYIRKTSMCNGMLEQGGRSGRVVREKYSGTLEQAQEPINDWGTTYIDCLLEDDRNGYAEVVCKGHLIQ